MSWILEYAKTSRAKCHGSEPCKGTPIAVNSLKFGQTVLTEYGENIQWRHWGCVTRKQLAALANIPVKSISGFRSLNAADAEKVKKAISLGHVDPADIPPSARIHDPLPSAGSSKSGSKRKAEFQSDEQRTADTPAHSTPTQDDAPPEDIPDELYVSLNSTVVGIQYYTGLVGSGEEVHLIREPQNQYDRNAIQVKNISRIQVGHIPKNIAAKLAPLLDANMINVEGTIIDGNLSGRAGYSLKITIRIYGPSDKRAQLEPRLVWATPGQRGFNRPTASSTGGRSQIGPSLSQANPVNSQPIGRKLTPAQQAAAKKQQEDFAKAAELRSMLNSMEKVDDEGRRSSLLDKLCSIEDVWNLPLHPNPPSIDNGKLAVNLLRHQIQGLQFCIEKEYPVLPKTEKCKPIQFWQLQKSGDQTHFFNLTTKTPQSNAPELGRGGIFADAMGLGKTLTMIALIIETKSDQPASQYCNASLIVVPLSVLSNWQDQINDHCVPGSLKVCVYYGANRSLTAAELAKYDVVITTYQVVSGEYDNNVKTGAKKKKIEQTLFDVKWKRIVLDEAHTIRNPKTKIAKSLYTLEAERRWALSGTPIINSPRDLGSLMTFLRVCRPLDDEDMFKRLLLRPLKDGNPAGAELLRALMSQVCMRRTKEMQDSNGNHLVPLPPVEMIVVPVALDADARRLYDEVEELSKQRVEGFLRGSIQTSSHSSILSMLTRMRQIALHPGLIPNNYVEDLRGANDAAEDPTPTQVQLTLEWKAKLQERLAQAVEECDECPICFTVPGDPRITTITETISRDPKCPMDRRPITMNDLHELSQLNQVIQITPAQPIMEGSSAKIDQLVQLLQFTPSNEKSLVFSQFTSFLDKIGESLEDKGISYARFDGSMSAKRRQETLARFSVPLGGNDKPSVEDLSGSCHRKTRKQTNMDDEDDFVPNASSDADFVMGDDEGDDDDYESSPAKKKNKGKGKLRARNDSPFDNDGDNPQVLLLSLKAGALGLNLTVANNVFLMDPWWQEGIESQAIDRVNRIGQKKNVHVYQLIAENTVESKVLEIQNKKKKLIKEAFSGIKRTETVREQREARLQELVGLFDVRRQAADQRL